MDAKVAPVGEKAIHAAISEVVMARQYHESNPNVNRHLVAAFESLLDALNEHRAGKPCGSRITVRLSPGVLERIDAMVASGDYMDRSHCIRAALFDFLSGIKPTGVKP